MYNSFLQFLVKEMTDANSDRIVGVELKIQNYIIFFFYLLYTDLHDDGLIRYDLNTLAGPY